MREFFEQFKGSFVQTFDDNKVRKDRSLIRKFPMLEIKERLNEITELNKNQAGIFFTPNPASGGRKEENITSIEWIYVDIDGGSKEEMEECISKSLIYPDIIVESSRGYHLYWKCKFENKSIFTNVILGLIEFYGGDLAIQSINEVLRMPGFFHTKDINNPFKIKIKHLKIIGTNQTDMQNKYGFNHPIHKFDNDISKQEVEIIKNLDIIEVLRELGVQIKDGFIWENGQQTSASINTKLNYINRFSGKPGSGSTIDAVMQYGNMDKPSAISYLKKKAGIKEQVISKTVSQGEHLINYGELLLKAVSRRKQLDIKNICRYGIKIIDELMVGILPSELVVIGADTGVGKSEFAYNISISNAEKGKKVLLLALEGDIDEIALRDLQRRINKNGTSLKTSDYRFNLKDVSAEEQQVIEKMSSILKTNLLIYKKEHIPDLDFVSKFIVANKDLVDMIVIDHLHYIQGGGENENQEIGKIMRQLKTITDIIRKPIVLISHLRKGVDRKKGEDPTLWDIHGSSNIAKEATSIILLTSMSKDKFPNHLTDKIKDKRYACSKILIQKSRIGLPKCNLACIFDTYAKEYLDWYQEIIEKESLATESDKVQIIN